MIDQLIKYIQHDGHHNIEMLVFQIRKITGLTLLEILKIKCCRIISEDSICILGVIH